MMKVLLTGQPRSLTTFLANYLNANKGCVFLRDSFMALFRESLRLGITSFHEVLPEKTKNIILFTLKAEMILFGKASISHLQSTQFTTLDELFNLTMKILVKDNTKVFGVKVTAAEDWLETLLKETDMKIIYLVRDLRDVLISSANAFAGYDRNYVSKRWSQGVAKALAIDNPRLIIIRFEDLILNPKKELERLSAFLGLKLDPNIKELKDVSGTDWLENSSLNDVEKLFDRKAVYRWKNHLDSIEVLYGSIVYKKLMRELGYEENKVPFTKKLKIKIFFFSKLVKRIIRSSILFRLGKKILITIKGVIGR